MVPQLHGDALAAGRVAPPPFVLQEQNAVLAPLVKAAMAHVVEDVILPPQQGIGQSRQGRFFHKGQREYAGLDQFAEGRLEVGLLLFHVQRLFIARPGEHDQHRQGRMDAEGQDAAPHVHIAHDGRVFKQGQKAAQ